MSIIAISGVPAQVSLKEIVKTLAKTIRGPFEALNFVHMKKDKIAYLRLSEKLDPLQVVEKVNGRKLRNSILRAFIPKEVPDLPLASKPKTIPKKLQKSLKITNLSDQQLVFYSYEHIMKEMQTKYTGLFELSAKTGHKLLNAIGKTIYERMCQIHETNKNAENCFKMTGVYRKRHPHFADFQLILSTLHAIQDVAGQPRQQIAEQELTNVAVEPYVIDNIPFDKVRSTCNKYADKIITEIQEHVSKLELIPENMSMIEAARVKVREQLKNLLPYLPAIVRQIIAVHFVPKEAHTYIVKVYGEPFLPGKDVMSPFTKRHRTMSTIRSDRMFNHLSLKVPRETLMGLLAADGTLIGGAKLVIRPSNVPLYKVPQDVLFGNEKVIPDEQPMEQDINEEWSETW